MVVHTGLQPVVISLCCGTGVTMPIPMKWYVTIWGRLLALGCCLLSLSLIAADPGSHVPPPGGVVPVLVPTGGLGIDGNLEANLPAAGVGDWIARGTGGDGVLASNGAPLNLLTTIHRIDPFGNSNSDIIFTGGLKWFDDPNTWRWTTGKPSSKTEINNMLFHLGHDAEGHIWVSVAADRASTSGDSYIDFEFLQNFLVRNGDGSFSSSGPHGGRTTNDLLLSLAFTGGGKIADFFCWRWIPNGAGGYQYVDATASLPTGRVFAALNSISIQVPFGAFDGTTYAPNAFAEAAVDLTALMSNIDPCTSFGFKTIMVKTKSSQSSTATIEDLIDPIQYTLNVGPSADAGQDQVRCSEGESTSFTLAGTASPGFSAVVSTNWSVIEGLATVHSPNDLNTMVSVQSGTVKLRLSIVQANGCTATDDVLLTVMQLPPCGVQGPELVCPSTPIEYRGPSGMTSYRWTVTGNGQITGSATGETVRVIPGNVCGDGFTLQLSVRSNLCERACAMAVMVNDTTPPVLIAPQAIMLECPLEPVTNLTGIATATDGCGKVTIGYTDAVDALCGGSRRVTRTWTATDACGNTSSATQTILIRDSTPPELVCPQDLTLDCPADTAPERTGVAQGRDTCGLVTVSFTDVVDPGCGGSKTIRRRWVAKDECGNETSRIQTITVRDTRAPVILCPQDIVLECPADTRTNRTGVATAQDECSRTSMQYADIVTNACGNTKVIRRTWTATDECGNSSSSVQTITVRDTVPPVIACPADVILDCPADTSTNRTGMASAQDGCGAVTISFADHVSGLCGQTKVIDRTWTAIDGCGNAVSCVQRITVRDITPPSLQVPAHVILECPADTRTNNTGVALAGDACGLVTVTYSDTTSPACGNTYVITRTWSATDDCGNRTTAPQTITVQDTRKPVIIPPPNAVLECPAQPLTNVTGVAVADDTCNAVQIRFTDSVSSPCAGNREIRRTWTATDACGNSASAVQTITIRDTTRPSLVCPPDVALECGQDTSPSATGTASAQDTCSRASVRYSDVVTPGCGGSKLITRTWTATDECGNSTSGVQRIDVRDTQPPTIECPIICTFSQGGYGGGGEPAQILEANFIRVFPQGMSVGVYNPSNGTALPNGLYWAPTAAGVAALHTAASDGGGASSAFSRDVLNPTSTYEGAGLARQAIALTLNIEFNAAGVIGLGPNNFGELVYTQAGDSLSGKTIREILAAANRALAGLGLPQGHDFSSLAGLLSNLNISYHDYEIPGWATAHLSAPAIIVQCASAVPEPNSARIRTSDSCGGAVQVTHASDVISDQSCPNRFILTRTWLAEDACGNRSSCSYQIIVNDTTPPVLITGPNKSVIEGQTWSFTTPTAIDNCGTATVRAVSTFTNLVDSSTQSATCIWEAVDECGNVSRCQQTITAALLPPPELQIIRISDHTVRLRWPMFPAGFELESTVNLTNPEWAPVSSSAVLINGWYEVQVSATELNTFFRLANPSR